jgi:4-hydroxy-tetrahydrodipicolinate synthase
MTRTALPLGGSMTALATPFTNGAIDKPAFVRLCQRQITRGTTALVVCGSIGEAASLQPEEYATLIRLAVSAANDHVPVIAGCDGPSTDAAANAAVLAAKSGAASRLCAPTPYVKPSQEGIIADMRMLAHVSDLPRCLALRDRLTSNEVRFGDHAGLQFGN